MLAFLLDRRSSWEPVDFPWEHPRAGDAPPPVKEALHQARIFSEVMHGSAILYNLMLAEKADQQAAPGAGPGGDRIMDYRQRLVSWARRRDFAPLSPGWPDESFWSIALRLNGNISTPARSFVSAWALHASKVRQGDPADTPAARKLVGERERAVKGPKKARLYDPSALALWNGEAGTSQLDFRWRRTQRIALDILEALPRA
jgi:hypothetical protein